MTYTKEQAAFFAATRDDLHVFLQQAFNIIYPGKQFLDNWHIHAIVHNLDLAIQGRRQRLIINLPPRNLKSFIVSVALPAYILGNDPSAKITCISYADELSRALARDFKRVVESPWYRGVFPEVRSSKSTENEFATDKGGYRFATSLGGTLTGRGGDFIIIDDPMKPEDAQSDKLRNSANEWYRSTLLSRPDDKQRSVLILVMQRLHVNDLTGYAEEGGGFHKLSFPAFAVSDEKIPVTDTEYHFRAEGEVLHPEHESEKALAGLRDQMGSFLFSAQYQQSPECPEGALFKRKYINIIDSIEGIARDGLPWISIDSAQSTKETADYSAISVGYSTEDGHYIHFAERGRWEYEDLLAKTLGYAKKYKDPTFVVENAANGIALIQYLRRARINCISYPANEDKMVRACRALPIFAEGRVFLVSRPGRNAWIEPYLNELMSFPHGRFDDQVDSLVQGVRWAEGRVAPNVRVLLI